MFPSFTSLLGLCCTRRFSSASRQADKVARCHKAKLKVPLIFCVAKATGHMNVYCTALEPFIVHGRTHRAESKNGSEQWNALISTLPPASVCNRQDSKEGNGLGGLLWERHPISTLTQLLENHRHTVPGFGKVSAHRVHNSTLGCPLSRCCPAFFNPTLFPWKKRSRLSLESFSMNFRQQIFHALLNPEQTIYLYT